MGIVIGMDEAGYGPNLGPLVISVTAWRATSLPAQTSFWAAFEPVLTQKFSRQEQRLHVADSKNVYTPGRGLEQLERSVLSLLGLLGKHPACFQELVECLSEEAWQEMQLEPWFAAADIALPLQNDPTKIQTATRRWQAQCDLVGIHPVAASSEIVCTGRFNRLSEQYQSKGVVLSRATMQLLSSVWKPDCEEKCLVIGDKHGGRNRYDGLLQEIAEGAMVFCRNEGTPCSEYRIHQTDIRFQTKAEEHFPVALASMISKYVREVSMELFNQFWQTHLPGLKPTKGYPVDARRFRKDVGKVQKTLQIPDQIFWRQR